MKRLIPIIISLAILSLSIQFLVVFFTKHHEVKYSIIGKNNEYMIYENFNNDRETKYEFIVEDNNNSYVFSYNGNLNKQENIIKDIKYYNEDNLECIVPIYKNNESGYFSCYSSGQQVSGAYLMQKENSSINKFFDDASKKYNFIIPSDKQEKIDNFYVYKDNLLDNVVFTMWSYKGFYLINNKSIEEKEFLTKDQYQNSYSKLIDKYYISADVDSISNFEFTKFYIYDITDGSRVAVDLETYIAHDFVINGVYDNKLYYTDYRTNQQFVLDPDKATVSLIGDASIGFKYFDGEKLYTIKDIAEFSNKKYFETNSYNEKLSEKYDILEIKKNEDIIFFKTKDGKFYKVYENMLDNPILLFEFSNVSEWKLSKDSLIVVVDNYLYYYSDDSGLIPIINSNELRYNYKNICDFMKK